MTEIVEDIRTQLSRESEQYSERHERPLAGYARIVGVYVTAVVGLGVAVRVKKGAIPPRPSVTDLAMVGLATAKMSRLVSRDPVTSPLRVPFTRLEHSDGDGQVHEAARGSGLRRSVGELVTCPFCLSQWIATGFTFGLMLAPNVTRQIAATFSALELADFLQYGRAAAKRAAG